jgi:tRNA threonylcarbamoyladenosine biosynthesis protein TsaE
LELEKTTLVAYIAKNLGIKDPVTSPTFAIVNSYVVPANELGIENLIHVDTYRLEHLNELFDLGLETIFDERSVTFVEWGDKIQDHIENDYFVIDIQETEPDARNISFSIEGSLSEDRVSRIDSVLTSKGWEVQD